MKIQHNAIILLVISQLGNIVYIYEFIFIFKSKITILPDQFNKNLKKAQIIY